MIMEYQSSLSYVSRFIFSKLHISCDTDEVRIRATRITTTRHHSMMIAELTIRVYCSSAPFTERHDTPLSISSVYRAFWFNFSQAERQNWTMGARQLVWSKTNRCYFRSITDLSTQVTTHRELKGFTIAVTLSNPARRTFLRYITAGNRDRHCRITIFAS